MHGTVGRAGEDGGIPPPRDGDSLTSSPQGHRAPAHGWRGWQGLDPEQGWGRATTVAKGEKQGAGGEGSSSPMGERVPGSSVDLRWGKGLGVRGKRKREKGGPG